MPDMDKIREICVSLCLNMKYDNETIEVCIYDF